MNNAFSVLRPLLLGLLLSGLAASPSMAQTPPPVKKKPPAKAAVKKGKTAAKAAVPAELVPPAATPEQVEAATRVYYGEYGCEFKQSIEITENKKYPSYVDVQFGKLAYVMKPVVSSTGAIRLEDVRGEMLMVQIAMKSMMLNTQTGHRMVDECINPQQRKAIDDANAERIAAEQKAKGAEVAAEASQDAAASAAAAK